MHLDVDAAACRCGCKATHPAHAVAGALATGDLGAALDAGLLDVPRCAACGPECDAALQRARDARLAALAARARHRARQARLARRQQERDARRTARVPPADAAQPAQPAQPAPSLPPAAAAALARAKARAAGRGP